MSKSKKIIAVAVLLVLVIGAALAYVRFSPQAQVGRKTIVLLVTHSDGGTHEFTMSTQAETLGDAMREINVFEGEDGPYGIFVTAVDGETVDSALEQWWCFTKDGETMMTGIDDTMIADGEHYEAVFTTGYDMF